ncbi:MAG TPA: hypothetical protein VNS12_05750 [Pelagibacterium sp.]|uniref:hypothetical protein n=1 Tax=Pelagibacterium sp. TaxID=1967288 RepID=UPI002C4E4DB1|nr:hypothetical protein [Pelagibacterium sp.]HWJ87553.1 hypothetical protein [Pelagibacterium sp.]
MSGIHPAAQGLVGVAAGTSRPAGRPVGRDPLRVDDSTGPSIGQPTPYRISPPPGRNQKDQQDQKIDPHVAPATLLDASLIAAALLNDGEARSTLPPSRSEPWSPPASSLTLHDRTV